MQGLADGYFVIPYTIGAYLSKEIMTKAIPTDHPAFEEAENIVKATIDELMAIKGTKPVDHFHKRLGLIIWNQCGMARNAEGLKKAISDVQQLRAEFWSSVRIPGSANEMNSELEKAGRVADFIELGELMCIDALSREESCGGHFREEHQTEEGEALRNDVDYKYVAAWEYFAGNNWELHKEELIYENIKIAQRSYK
jgi:succinate dehydrogenase / fumarate reductase flavoprotein subunit